MATFVLRRCPKVSFFGAPCLPARIGRMDRIGNVRRAFNGKILIVRHEGYIIKPQRRRYLPIVAILPNRFVLSLRPPNSLSLYVTYLVNY